jgi:lipid-A-disaccharide synthase
MISSGEASGDLHGAALASALTRLNPETSFTFFGSGGQAMRAAGVELLVDINDIATIGVTEVIRALPRFYRAYRRMIAAAVERKPHAVVLIDWPDFNMRLARRLRRLGTRVIYYISPQVWAWRRHRVLALERDVDRMLVILPFEEEFYRAHGVPAEYVGHPLSRAVLPTVSAGEFRARHQLDERPIISFMPGSRHSEIHHHLPLMLDASTRIGPAKQYLLLRASTIDRAAIESEVRGVHSESRRPQLNIIDDDAYNALSFSELAVVASGTATVEAALAGTPMVIVYRGSELSFRLLRPLIHLDTFGMVNLIAGRSIVPELIQHDATGERIAREVKAILGDSSRLARMKQDLAVVRDRLQTQGPPGAERAAQAVLRSIQGD